MRPRHGERELSFLSFLFFYVARFNIRITFMYNEEHNLKIETIVLHSFSFGRRSKLNIKYQTQIFMLLSMNRSQYRVAYQDGNMNPLLHTQICIQRKAVRTLSPPEADN